MPIENRNLEPGTKLVATSKKDTYRAEVIAGEEGKVLYRLEDGQEFKSPSAAGSAITGQACNGWRFWSVDTASAPDRNLETGSTSTGEGADSESTLAEDEESPEAAGAEQIYVPLEEGTVEAPVTAFRRVPNQKGVDEGQVRLYCESCQKSFTTPADQPVDTCPEGHSPGQSETREE